MARTPKITNEDFETAKTTADDLDETIHDLATRIMNGHTDKINNPIELARTFSLLTRSATNLIVQLITLDDLQKQREKLEALRATKG